MSVDAIDTHLKGASLQSFIGYAKTGSKAPYVVVRPMTALPDAVAVCGQVIDWDNTFGVYCVGDSVEASYNLAKLVVSALQGKRVGADSMSCSVGYAGSLVEGRYESQVTIQLNQGVLS